MLLPKHNTFVCVKLLAKAAAGCVMVVEMVCVHPFASVIVTKYVPAANPVKPWVVAALLHAYVYGAVPPLTVKSIAPVLLPKQSTFVWLKLLAKAEAGWVIVVLIVWLQELASVIVTE